MDRRVTPKSSLLQMAFLGFVALSIGIVCLLDVVFVYHLPPLTSISESATTGSRTGMLVPFALGCMFTYCIAYVGYCRADVILTRIMAVAFAVVAMQICDSPYIAFERVGLLGLSRTASGIVHGIASVTGFGAMFVWIAFYFTRGDQNPTREKLIRNQIYFACAAFMAAGILLFILGLFGIMGAYSAFIAEEFMLIPTGFALFVKSGLVFRDKNAIRYNN